MRLFKHTLRFLIHPVRHFTRRKYRRRTQARYRRHGYVNPLRSGSLPLAPLPSSHAPTGPRGVHPRSAPARPILRSLALANQSYTATSEGYPMDVETTHEHASAYAEAGQVHEETVMRVPDSPIVQAASDSPPRPLFGFAYSHTLEVTVQVAAETHRPIAASPTRLHEQLLFLVRKPQVVTVIICDALGNQMAQLYNDWVSVGDIVQLAVDDESWPTGAYFVRAEGEHFITMQGFTLTR